MRINKSLVTNQVTGAGTGSVTSVAMTVPTGLTISGSPITSSGTLALGFASGVALPPSQTGNAGKYLTTDGTSLSWGNISGSISGTANYVPFFATSSTLGTSPLYYDGSYYMAIGTTTTGTGRFLVYNNLADTHLQISGTTPSIRITDTPTSATYNTVIGLAISSNSFITNTVAGDLAIANATGGSILFGIGTDEKMRIFTSTGNISIGGNSTDSGWKFDLVGSDARINGIRIGKGNGSFATNVAFGFNALNSFSGTSFGSNTSIGSYSLQNCTTGYQNTAIGISAMLSTTTANSNVAIGSTSLYNNLIGNSCVAIGHRALFTSNANYNVGIGADALYLTTGASNTGIGTFSGREISSGISNTTIGYQAGRGITTGSYNTIIGANLTGLSATLSNNIIISDGQANQRINVNSSGSVGFGTGTTIAASAKLELISTTQGFLPPRMTNAQRTAIASPAVGLIVYCTDATEGLYVYKSGGWTFII